MNTKQSKHNDLIIIDDITSFSYDDYDPLKNYFVYFNKSNKRQISQAEYSEYVDSILPNTTQIQLILKLIKSEMQLVLMKLIR